MLARRTTRVRRKPQVRRLGIESLETRRLLAADILVEQVVDDSNASHEQGPLMAADVAPLEASDKVQAALSTKDWSERSSSRVHVSGETDLSSDTKFKSGDEVLFGNGTRFQFDSPQSGRLVDSEGNLQRYAAIELVVDPNLHTCRPTNDSGQRECWSTLIGWHGAPAKEWFGGFVDERVRFQDGSTSSLDFHFYGIPTNEPALYTNPRNPHDVNADGEVTGDDVQAIVAELKARGVRQLTEEGQPSAFVDVNGDGLVSSVDMLQTATFLRDVDDVIRRICFCPTKEEDAFAEESTAEGEFPNVAGEFPNVNPDNPLDVDANGIVNNADLLLVVNELRENGVEHEVSRQSDITDAAPPFFDTTSDNMISIQDAVVIIGHLGQQLGSGTGNEFQIADILSQAEADDDMNDDATLDSVTV